MCEIIVSNLESWFYLMLIVTCVIMPTASHLPYNRNGFKFFTNGGGLGKADIKDILERAADIYNKFMVEGLFTSKQKVSASIERVDYMSVYTSDLVKAVQKAAGNIGISEMFHESRNLFESGIFYTLHYLGGLALSFHSQALHI